MVQDTDWLSKGPFQQNHLMENLALKGHEIRVIDYEILWRTHGTGRLYSFRRVLTDVSRVHRGGEVTLIRPAIVRVPYLDYFSLALSDFFEINRQLKEFKPDVVVGFHILSAYIGRQAARRNHLPYIYYWVDVYHRQIPLKLYQPIGKMLEKKMLRVADRVIVINDKLQDYVLKLGSPKDKTQVIRGTVDTKLFNIDTHRGKVREQLGIREDDLVLFFMGWLYHFSGLKEVALELAKNPDPKLKFLILGEGDAYTELEKIREAHHLQDRVILTGKKPYQEIPEYIASADVCLLPAYTWEPIMRDIVPIKMYEYMAMQKPVISTRLPGVMKEFGEGNGVIYVDKPEEVVAKALELVRTGQARELGLKARKFVERNNWDRITDEFERILNEVIAEKKARRP